MPDRKVRRDREFDSRVVMVDSSEWSLVELAGITIPVGGGLVKRGDGGMGIMGWMGGMG